MTLCLGRVLKQHVLAVTWNTLGCMVPLNSSLLFFFLSISQFNQNKWQHSNCYSLLNILSATMARASVTKQRALIIYQQELWVQMQMPVKWFNLEELVTEKSAQKFSCLTHQNSSILIVGQEILHALSHWFFFHLRYQIYWLMQI